MTAADNPYAALEALEVKARTSRKHSTTQRLGNGRSLVVEQDAAVRDPHYRGGAVFEHWYRYRVVGRPERLLTRVEAQDLLDGYEPEPQAPPTPVANLAAPPSLQTALDRPVKYTTPTHVVIASLDSSRASQQSAKAEALAGLYEPEWWDAIARYVGDGWHVSFERRIRRRE